MSGDAKAFMERFEEEFYDLPEHERPHFALMVLRAGRDKLRASIGDRATGTEKEQTLLVVQKYDETIAEFERLLASPGPLIEDPNRTK